MILTVRMAGEWSSDDLREQAKSTAERVLGRLVRRVSHAAISLREHAHPVGARVHVCNLRLRVPGATDILIESLRPSRDAAITGALKQARREIVRRRRSPLRALAWPSQPLPTPA